MTQKYDIKSLIETFEDHYEKFQLICIEQKQKYIENNPGQPLPDHMNDDFSISKALNEICKEIHSMQKSLDKVWDHINNVED